MLQWLPCVTTPSDQSSRRSTDRADDDNYEQWCEGVSAARVLHQSDWHLDDRLSDVRLYVPHWVRPRQRACPQTSSPYCDDQRHWRQMCTVLAGFFFWRAIDIANLSVCLSVCPSVRYVPVSDENGLTYRHSFSTIRYSPISLVLPASNQTSSRNSDGITPCGGAKYRWGIKILRFSTNKSFIHSFIHIRLM